MKTSFHEFIVNIMNRSDSIPNTYNWNFYVKLSKNNYGEDDALKIIFAVK